MSRSRIKRDAEVLIASMENVSLLVDEFITEAGITPTKFGMMVAGDTSLVHRLRKGNCNMTLRKVLKISRFIMEHMDAREKIGGHSGGRPVKGKTRR